MEIKCKNCGTCSTYKKVDGIAGEQGIIITHTCACGRAKNKVFYIKALITDWEDGKLVNQEIPE